MTDGFPYDFGSRSDDELYVLLGAELDGAGLGISPADRERYQRFARTWLDNKRSQLWRKIQESETYRLWLDSAGSGQIADPDTADRVLGEQEGWDSRPAVVLALLLVREKCAEVVDSCDIVVAFAQERRKIYGQRTLHCVPFISTRYLSDGMPLDGFSAAMVRAIGGDEAHSTPDADYQTFMDRTLPIVKKYGKTVLGWHESVKTTTDTATISQCWGPSTSNDSWDRCWRRRTSPPCSRRKPSSSTATTCWRRHSSAPR